MKLQATALGTLQRLWAVPGHSKLDARRHSNDVRMWSFHDACGYDAVIEAGEGGSTESGGTSDSGDGAVRRNGPRLKRPSAAAADHVERRAACLDRREKRRERLRVWARMSSAVLAFSNFDEEASED